MTLAAGFEGEKEPWDAFWGQRYALLGDPDALVRPRLGARAGLGSPRSRGSSGACSAVTVLGCESFAEKSRSMHRRNGFGRS